ncbi:Gfo/Idh/MocA family protein [Streptomyces sp. NPDC053048]|uniref:Gfo/Idh/MocA family protein n=1 Tax=Streptomyces sp. NPDC053048 TaxID=3365694 RepID=UPI0037CCE5F2
MTHPTRQWRVAVAGCGAAAFGLHLPTLADHPAFDIVTVHDREPERARLAARRFAVPRIAHSTEQLLEGADMLAVLTGVHDTLIDQALDAGLHVFTEKPVSLDVERTRALISKARRAGRLLEVGAMRAHDPALHALLAAVPDPAGGWLIKADGADEAARRAVLPPGLAPYTFAADPPQPTPAHLSDDQLAALRILLWQGYHLLTALVLAVPDARPGACTLAAHGQGLTATAHGRAGALFTLAIVPATPGDFREQIHLAGGDFTATLDFARPYEPAAGTRLTTRPSLDRNAGFGDPFTAMWNAVGQRLSGQHPADLPTSAALALRVEELALALAATTTAPEPHHQEEQHARR